MKFPPIAVIDLLATTLFFYLLVTFRDHRRRRGLPYPPGPPPFPIIGDVFSIRIFGHIIVVLNSLSAVKDLLELRSDVYADRPRLPVMEIQDIGWVLTLCKNNANWREGRRLLDHSLRSGAMTSYRHIMEEETHGFLAKLLATPENFRRHTKFLQGRLITSLTYGYDLKIINDIIEAPTQATEDFSRFVIPGGAMINYLPFLRHIPSWVPWFSYKPLAQSGKERSKEIKDTSIAFVKNAMLQGTAVPSLASEYLQEIENLAAPEYQKKEELIKQALGSILAAGADSTVSSMASLFLALTLYPDVQKRAQAELDFVLAGDRLPTFDDRPHLRYIDALCKELLRWQMVTPLAVPHAPSEDDIYRGFFIPKGCTIIVNTCADLRYRRAILHDPEIYPDPEVFNPERFLNKDGSLRDDPVISLAYGAGKRICPGRHFVDATLFIVVSSVLSVFDVTKARDENGHEIPVNVSPNLPGGIVMHPEVFRCSITPRDKVAEELIQVHALP
ncbi:cytochrome P450 [Lactifluus volemus]|nr:cytochrome P450 [Lactifluus volemus]